MLDLQNSTEPLRQVAVIVTAFIVALGTGLAAIVGMVDWPWIAPAATFFGATGAALISWLGLEKARSVVTPGPNVAALLASSEPYVEPWDIDLSDPDHADSDVITNPADEPVGTAALDAAAEAAGLA